MTDRKRQAVKPLRAADLARTRRDQVPAVEAPAEPATEVVAPSETKTPAKTPAGKENTSTFTARLDFDTLDAFDGLVRTGRRKLARQVTKLDVLTVLVNLAADDAALRDQMIAELGRRLK